MKAQFFKVVFGCLLALALAESVYSLWAPRQLETDAEWSTVAAQIRKEFRAGDLIVFSPYWADQRGRQFLGDLISPRMAARPDNDNYSRIWEVSLDGSQSSDTKWLSSAADRMVGRFHLRRYEKSSTTLTYDFSDHFSEANVGKRLPSGELQLCHRAVPGFLCGPTRLENRTLEVDYQPRRGILAPVIAGAKTEIEYPAATLGQKLIGYTAMADFFSRKNAKGAVIFRVFVEGQEKFSRQHKNNDGWSRFEIDTADMAKANHAVRFEISAPEPAWRTFGFHVEARK